MVKAAELVWMQTFEKMGEGQYVEYRIPGIVVTSKGTLICYYEGRMSTRNDWATIHITLCRSIDDGKTWEKQVIELPEEMGRTGNDTYNNPVLMLDHELIHLLFHQNYKRVFHCVSKDDGITWSIPEEITYAYRELDWDWNVCATGPGHGICLADGTLVAPVWIANGEQIDEVRVKHWPSRAGTVYSEDRGKTWHGGALTEGLLDANETTITELNDGRILYNFRNREQDLYRRLAWSEDHGKTMGKIQLAKDLRDPWCFGSMVSLRDGTVLFSNCDVSKNPSHERVNQVVKQSIDQGETWEKVIEVDDIGGYSDIAVHNDSLYVLYERTVDGCIKDLILKKYHLT